MCNTLPLREALLLRPKFGETRMITGVIPLLCQNNFCLNTAVHAAHKPACQGKPLARTSPNDRNCQSSDAERRPGRGNLAREDCRRPSFLLKAGYLLAAATGDFRVFRLALKLRRTLSAVRGLSEIDMSQSSQFLKSPKNSPLVPDLSPLEHLMDQDVTPRQLCSVLAKMFQVQQTEVALLRLEHGLLQFIYPDELRTAGSIPISSSSIAAHTAISKKSEIFNNFARVKHASIFETVKLGVSEGIDTSEPLPIQKLMSAPVVDENHRVLGVIQISRKGSDS